MGSVQPRTSASMADACLYSWLLVLLGGWMVLLLAAQRSRSASPGCSQPLPCSCSKHLDCRHQAARGWAPAQRRGLSRGVVQLVASRRLAGSEGASNVISNFMWLPGGYPPDGSWVGAPWVPCAAHLGCVAAATGDVLGVHALGGAQVQHALTHVHLRASAGGGGGHCAVRVGAPSSAAGAAHRSTAPPTPSRPRMPWPQRSSGCEAGRRPGRAQPGRTQRPAAADVMIRRPCMLSADLSDLKQLSAAARHRHLDDPVTV